MYSSAELFDRTLPTTSPTSLQAESMAWALTPIRLQNDAGLALELLPYGATIRQIYWLGQPMTLSYAEPLQYLQDPYYLGSTVGRFANRIADGRVRSPLGDSWTLDANQAPHTLHGGRQGFSHKIWHLLEQTADSALLYLDSPAGDQGFPGRLQVFLQIALIGDRVCQRFTAMSDAATPVNLTNHCYFNLDSAAEPLPSIERHQLQVFADQKLITDSDGIPVGPMVPVSESIRAVAEHDLVSAFGLELTAHIPEQDDSWVGRRQPPALLDFRQPRPLSRAYSRRDLDQSVLLHGLDHCYVCEPHARQAVHGDVQQLPLRARLQGGLDARGERVTLEVYSSQPALQVYSANYLGAPFSPFTAICLEAQNLPDAPNRRDFPNPWLKAGDCYLQQIDYRFC